MFAVSRFWRFLVRQSDAMETGGLGTRALRTGGTGGCFWRFLVFLSEVVEAVGWGLRTLRPGGSGGLFFDFWFAYVMW